MFDILEDFSLATSLKMPALRRLFVFCQFAEDGLQVLGGAFVVKAAVGLATHVAEHHLLGRRVYHHLSRYKK